MLQKKIKSPVSHIRRLLQLSLVLVMSFPHIAAHAEVTLLNVSYDVTRELFKDLNPLFITEWKKTHAEDVVITQSYRDSSKHTL